jgi:glycosyltransferase involved in cell wall biosynthesis
MSKVLILASGYKRDDSRVVIRQAHSVIKNGFETVLLINDGLESDVVDGLFIEKVRNSRFGRKGDLIFAYSLWKKHILGHLDANVVIIHSPELLMFSRFFNKRSIKVIYDEHEDMSVHLKERISNRLLSNMAAYFYSSLIKHISAYIHVFISPHIHVAQKYSKLKSSVEIPNFPVLGDKIARKNSSGMSPCYLGTVYSYSNMGMIDKICGTLKLNCNVAGYIDPKLLSELHNISFHGRLSKISLRKLAEKVNVGLVVYDYRENLNGKTGSFGTNKLLEYMELGLAVICTDLTLWHGVVKEWDCGVCVTPGDEEGLTNAFKWFHEHPDEITRMGSNGRRAIETKYSWSKIENKFIRLIKDAAL